MIWLILGLFFICIALMVYGVVPMLRLRADSLLKEQLKRAEADLDSLYLEAQAKQVLYASLICSFASLLFGMLLSGGGLFAGMGFAIAGYFLPRLYFNLKRARRHDKLNQQLVGALELLANAQKAGASLNQAIALIPKELPAPISQEFGFVLREVELGVTLKTALSNMAERVKSNEFDLLVIATNIAIESGGNLGEVFDRISKTIRERNNVLGKIQAMTAEGKMQGIFVSMLPVILGVGLLLIDPVTMLPFFTTTIGYILIAVVIVMQMMGGYFIKKVITIDV